MVSASGPPSWAVISTQCSGLPGRETTGSTQTPERNARLHPRHDRALNGQNAARECSADGQEGKGGLKGGGGPEPGERQPS